MKKKLIIWGVIALLVAFPIAKKLFKTEKVKQVTIEQVSNHTIKASILASGQLKHEVEVKLSSEVIGKVSKLYVNEGDVVTKGQLLLEIDDEAFVASVELQKAAVDQQKVAIERQHMVVSNLQKQLKRKTSLYNKKLLDSDAYEDFSNNYNISKVDLKGQYELLKQVQARLDQSLDQLSKTKIRSPINGSITSLDIKQGETAISGTTNIAGSSLMTIADPSSMLAEINIDEADIANLKIGQKAEIIAIAFADNPIVGIVESIASSAKSAPGRQSLSFAVKLKIDFSEESDVDKNILHLRPGMSCRAEVFTQGDQELLAISVKSIQINEDLDQDKVASYVFKYVDGVAKKTPIKTGISDDDFQQITGGLEKDEWIISGPDKILRYLKDGDKVEKIESEK
jgi:HlyD family secretion protein